MQQLIQTLLFFSGKVFVIVEVVMEVLVVIKMVLVMEVVVMEVVEVVMEVVVKEVVEVVVMVEVMVMVEVGYLLVLLFCGQFPPQIKLFKNHLRIFKIIFNNKYFLKESTCFSIFFITYLCI